MASSPELDPQTIFGWLNQFESSHLTSTSRQIVDAVQQAIDARRYPDADELLERLQQINAQSPERYEMAEVSLESGFAYQEMGYMNLAAQHLKQAIREFPSGTGNNHKQLISRCLLSLLEWRDPSTRNQAVVNWRRCLDELAALQLRADRDHQRTRAEWYADRFLQLQYALTERMSEFPARARRANASAISRPGAGALPDRFRVLVDLLAGERVDAERWINLERKNEPDRDRTEYIERAIEKILRSSR